MGGNNFPGDVDLDVFVNNAQALENQIEEGEQEEGHVPAPAPAAAAVQLVYECCDRIRLQGLHPHPDIRRISGDLLRLEDASNDFNLYVARVGNKALEILEKLNDVFQEPANINLTPYEPTLRAQLVEEAWGVVIEFHEKLCRRLQRIEYMYKYHIRSIQELQLRKQKGDLGTDVFSLAKYNYLSGRLTSLRLTSGFNTIGMLPLAILIHYITCYLLHYHSKKKMETRLKKISKRTFSGNTFLALFYFMCSVIITAIIIGEKTHKIISE